MKTLVVIDVQNDFITGSLGSTEAQKKIPAIIEKIKTGAWDRIAVTQDTHEHNYMDTQEGKYLPVPHCIRATNGWKIDSEVQKALREAKADVVYLLKPTFGSFELPDACKGSTEIEIIGFCTDICVISNAIMAKAYFPEANINVNSNLCAGTSIEAHDNALKAMHQCQINII